MPFALDPDASIRGQLKRVARQQLRRAEKQLLERRDGGVHEARRRVKKVRALLQLLETAGANSIRKSAQRLRAATHRLGTLRDLSAAITTIDLLRQRFPKRLPEHTYAIVKRELGRARAQHLKKADVYSSLAKTMKALRTVRRSSKRWDVPSLDSRDLAPVLRRSYRSSRKSMQRARKTQASSDFHRWRRRVKTLWLQLRLTAPCAPRLGRDLHRWKQLEQVLGDAHDLTLLDAAIANGAAPERGLPGGPSLPEMSSALQASLRRQALTLGERLFAKRPKAFERDVNQALSDRRVEVRSGRRPAAVA